MGYDAVLSQTVQLGPQVLDTGVHFALWSGEASRVELCLYDPTGRTEVSRIDCTRDAGGIWTGFIPDLKPGALYGYRVHGAWNPEAGQRFNPAKLLLDPYAPEVFKGAFRWGTEHYGHQVPKSPGHALRQDMRDNGSTALKGRVAAALPATKGPPRPQTPWPQTLIGELHARGFTIRHPDLTAEERGTFDGLGTAQALDYLKSLGLTAIELLPIHAFLDDHRLERLGLRNYWGYNSIGFFAPEPRYQGTTGRSGLRDMVRAAHGRGLEVLLDVVYNHTAEGNHLGPTLSFKGIDNRAYYRLKQDNPGEYDDVTGCGATLNAEHPMVQRLIVDSLRHWVTTYEVDGFRFDLAPASALTHGRFDPCHPVLEAISNDAELAKVKLIAEPWHVGEGGYQLGHFPPGWAEWNDRFRIATRRFWRGDRGQSGAFARVFHGSADLFEKPGRGPWSSINYAACHDGFPIHDLASYAQKHNEANGEDNRDGASDNDSLNFGHEGPSPDHRIEALRARHARNLLASVYLSFGTPMLLVGDEAGRTQGGMNNAYAQDNEIGWTDWERANSELGQTQRAFVRRLAALRRLFAPYSRARHAHGGHDGTTLEINWCQADARPMHWQDWEFGDGRFAVTLIDADPCRDEPGHDKLHILFNPVASEARFVLPALTSGVWTLAIDTCDPLSPDTALPRSGASSVRVPARTLMAFVRRLDTHHPFKP
jgi:isoamylase